MSRAFERTQARWLKQFGRAVRAARTSRGLSQEKLGELAGLDRTYVSGVERGVRNPTVAVVRRLATALGYRAGDLFRDADH